MEQVLDWLNENELRAYPLLDSANKTVTAYGSSWTLPDNFLLDLQLVTVEPLMAEITAPSGHTLQVSVPVKLLSATSNSTNTVTVTFGTATQTLAIFSLSHADAASYPAYVRNSQGCLAVFGEGVKDFLNNYTQDQVVSLNIPVEPSTVTQFSDAWLGVHTVSASPEKISKQQENVTQEPLLPLEDAPMVSVLSGDVTFLEGYNFRVNIYNELIDLEISTSYGLKMNCTASFIPSRYLDCDELVSYINGIAPDASGNFKLNAGSNIVISSGKTLASFDDNYVESANTHSLFVGLSFQSTDLCAPVNLTPTV